MTKRALDSSQVEYYVVPLSCISRDLYLSLYQLCCNALLEKFFFEKNKMVSLDIWFPVDMKNISNSGMLKRQLNVAHHKVEKHFDAFVERGLGWVMKRVIVFLCFSIGSSFSKGVAMSFLLPVTLRKRQCCLSISRADSCWSQDTCFLDCLAASIRSLKRNPSHWCALYSQIEAIILVIGGIYVM